MIDEYKEMNISELGKELKGIRSIENMCKNKKKNI